MRDPRTVEVTVGSCLLTVYVAESPREWRRGLVGCDLAGADGMLFVFGSDVQLAFHMAGMTTPVLIAFFTKAGELVDVTYLATDARPYTPAGRYRYVLELVGDHARIAGALDLVEPLVEGMAVPVS